MPRLLQVSHGYPPLEMGGTEIYAHRVSTEMHRRGWEVEVIAATRNPGRPHGSMTTEEGAEGRIHRLVNNLPWRPLGRAERDRGVEAQVDAVVRQFQPDLVHIQHLLFLSAHLTFPCPSLHTLHDAWAWCARGGNLRRDGREICPGPEASACVNCYADWASGSAVEHGLARAAGVLGKVVSPETLRLSWARVPTPLKTAARKRRPRKASSGQWSARQQAVANAHARATLRVAPSAWLASEAEKQGLGDTLHLAHGVAPGPERVGGGPLLFLGSLVPHKGAHLVVEAWQKAQQMQPGLPGLDVVGPAVDPAYAASLPPSLLRGALAPAEVGPALARAQALVLGSTWPENAPLVVLEARASGCPVIAPDLGGIPEILEDGRDGLLYPPGNVAALCQALLEVCRRPFDEIRRPPSFGDHVDSLETLYRKLVPLL